MPVKENAFKKETLSRETFKDYLMQIPNFLAFFLVPVSFLSIGPALIEIGRDFSTSPENINLIFMFFPAGIVAGQLTSTFYNRKFKRAQIILASYAFLFAINTILFFAKNISLFYILSIIAGYFIGINYVQSTENILSCKIKNKDRLVLLMISFYPIGALIAPLISSSLVKNNISWRFTYLIIAATVFLIALLYILISLRGENRIIASETQKVSLKEIFTNKKKNTVFIMILLIAVTYIVGETVLSTWSPTYLRLAKGFDIQSAALAVTFFQIFIVAGRFISSIIAGKIKTFTILISISIIALISIIFFVLSDSKFFLYLTISFAGLGYSAMYPLLVSSGSAIYDKGKGILISIVFATAYFGKTLAPYITKKIAEFNLTFSITVALIFSSAAALLIIALIIYNRIKS